MATVDHRTAFIRDWLEVYRRGYFSTNKIEVILGDIYDELTFTRQEDAPDTGWKPWCGDSKPPHPDYLYTVMRRDGTKRTGTAEEVGQWHHREIESPEEIIAYTVVDFVMKNTDWQLEDERVFATRDGELINAVTVDVAGGSESAASCHLLAKRIFRLLSGKTAPNHGWKPALVCLPTKDDEDPFGHVVIKRDEQAKPKFIRSCFVRRELADHPKMQWCPSGLSLPREKD